MNANIDFSSLPSQIARASIGNNGIREIKGGSTVTQGGLGDVVGNVIARLWSGVSGFILNAIASVLSATASAIWSFFVQTAQFIWNFDFNAPDQVLDQSLANMKLIIASQLGGTLGNAVGYLTCGVIPAAGIFLFNESLGMYLLKEVGEEMFDEFMGNLMILTRTTFNIGIRYLFTTMYKAGRRAIKKYFSDPGSPQTVIARRLFGDGITDKIKAWGNGKGIWSFANETNQFVDSIDNDFLQEFTEEFLEEAADGCVEAGYVLARGIDDWTMQQRVLKKDFLGAERGVEITPDRSAPDERIILVGSERLVKQSMTQAMMTYQMVENRDVGQWVGEPVREYCKAAPTKFSLKIVWSRYDAPPLFRGDDVYKPPSLEIKGFDRTKIDFGLIKSFAGGVNGRNWGRFWASAALLDDFGNVVSRPKLFAGSEEEAADILTNLLSLSDYEIGTMSSGEERKVGRKAAGRALAKETMKVYPAYISIMNAEKVLSEIEGQDQLAGTYKRRNQRLPLWTVDKPAEWDDVVTELLRTPGVNITAP